jgi:hypothetical protein
MRGGRTSVGRRVAVGLLTIAATALLVADAAAAASAEGRRPAPQPEVLTVDGPFTASAQLLGGCGEFRHIIDGTGEWSALGASTLHLDFCIGSPPDGVHHPVLDGGTFTISAADGTLTGTMTGDVQPGGTPPPEVGFPFHFDLVTTGGTGRFATATGSFVVDGAFGYGALNARGTVSGTITIPPGPPQSVDDCKRGGWRYHVDDHGRPFRSKRHCIRYVLHHQP